MLFYCVGHDHREWFATEIICKSAEQHSTGKVDIHLLDHMQLRHQGLFWRPWRIDEKGQYWDETDGKPFSTQFSHTRFLTPILGKKAGAKWALFTDADMLWLDNPEKFLDYADDRYTVMVVPHNFKPTTEKKMDSMIQARYNRKLWSAVMLWNCRSPNIPTVEMVNEADGSFLHQFKWLKDEEIGFLPEEFHWIAEASPTIEDTPRFAEPVLVHYTLGVPHHSMKNRKETLYDKLWQEAFDEFASTLTYTV